MYITNDAPNRALAYIDGAMFLSKSKAVVTEVAPQRKRQPRIPSLDGLRFIMCFGILVYHYSSTANSLASGFPHFPRFAYFTDIFFMLSGFFLVRQNAAIETLLGYRDFISHRLARIYPLHFVVGVAFIFKAWLVESGVLHVGSPPSTDGAWLNLMLLHGWGFDGASLSLNPVTWSLSALFALYIFYPIFAKFVLNFPRTTPFFIVVVAFCFELITQQYGRSLTLAHHADLGVLRALPSFVFGMWLGSVAIKPSLGLTTALGCVAFIFLVLWPEPLQGPFRIFSLAIALFVFLQLDLLQIRTPLAWAPFSKMAKYSFGIYLVHMVVYPTILWAGNKFFPHSVVTMWGFLPLSMAATLGAAMVTYRIIEQPGQRLFLRLSRARSAQLQIARK